MLWHYLMMISKVQVRIPQTNISDHKPWRRIKPQVRVRKELVIFNDSEQPSVQKVKILMKLIQLDMKLIESTMLQLNLANLRVLPEIVIFHINLIRIKTKFMRKKRPN